MHISKPAGPLPAPVPFYRQLYFQVVVAIVLGALLGHFEPAFAESLKPLGDAFIKLVKMIIAPVIFLTIVTGIAGMTHLKTVGRVFAKSMTYFLFFSTLALIVGMVVAHAVQPGAGMNINPAELDQSAVNTYVQKSHELSLVGFLMDIIPATLISAFVDGNILQVLFVAVLFGIALALVGERGRPVLSFLEALTAPVFRLVHMLMKAAPIGAFGAIAFTIGKYGVESLVNLAWLVGSFYLTSLFFVLVILGIVCRLCGFSVLKLIRYLKAELLLVLGTSSSESALPSLMEKMEKAGCEKSVVGLVVPTGYSFNLDGTNIYMTLAALFIAQATNVDLTLGQQITLLAVAMLSSKGAAGVTGAGFITLAATLSVVPDVPVAGMALILGVDRFMSECRSLTNFIGNAVATVVVSRWENALDRDQLSLALDGRAPPLQAPVPPPDAVAPVSAR
ncbi:dicarboxylate/amino acid:cation symporter [Xanthomonas campestris]|jgi:aerobic C4-dicarboxylate transport protein|uniref:dicarboxylate/amino acid:cation symporter n=1 Tax=Xanthomonas campestris TaxID=339 RepID=UPI0005DAEEA2|nr:dicarboxylate/amino acid:cation symporter [Xanthomonas campestris]MCC5052511.1 dicarboxylate/amino acid:cation symporter [Xanthomonas campestris pv. aberrans]MDM7683452.1 dicarboxylate/amino acid:cation symporter [Xanthomonas campestris pv. campestris]MDM7687518.1 dicarboxylate/amino acid:cation symporter [Xanthomonas campestris pv. campestris]MDM7704281.1 dicarboxylate/amino acid:cation symporter [Xanthomonas campestris pv. campestris]MDM7708662.1 dicarboxylate/amino acid:cation symporter 